MIDLSFATIMLLLQQNSQNLIWLVLGISVSLHVILIIVFLGIAWNRNDRGFDAISAEKVVLGLYTTLLVIDALIYSIVIPQGNLPYNPMIASNPVVFFILFSPPIPLMYLNLRLEESSGIYTSLSDSGLVLLAWLVVIVIVLGAAGPLFMYYSILTS